MVFKVKGGRGAWLSLFLALPTDEFARDLELGLFGPTWVFLCWKEPPLLCDAHL